MTLRVRARPGAVTHRVRANNNCEARKDFRSVVGTAA